MSRWGTLALVFVAAAISACSTSPAVEIEASETTTARTPRITDDSGRPPVTFDPCYDIPDEVMEDLGYDAGSKELEDMPMGSYTFLGCGYEGTVSVPGVLARYDLLVLAGNVSLDEELEKNGTIAEETQVNGRRALLEVDPSTRDTCRYFLQTDFGMVGFSRIHHKDHAGPVPQDEWCAGFKDLVRTLETFIQA
ncbi:DUF3558 domain-containing protein [Rhodococcus sp. Z13]|uniref:DUF3558 domain-containing protein n=1 Tax=Rhodococcus sacchari TaxID=2962047 RepID=A0ACD4DJG2_9NOCA|nr:DUF3558 domain-containing protein [Rhodococcus sp. Z13]UYP20180.1 DUF3558 domain-containing protein [Rhodococcus sp. Z13]